MILTTTMAKNMEKVILSGRYEADKMLSDIEASLKRNRITVAEADYLKDLIEKDIEERIKNQVKQLG